MGINYEIYLYQSHGIACYPQKRKVNSNFIAVETGVSFNKYKGEYYFAQLCGTYLNCAEVPENHLSDNDRDMIIHATHIILECFSMLDELQEYESLPYLNKFDMAEKMINEELTKPIKELINLDIGAMTAMIEFYSGLEHDDLGN